MDRRDLACLRHMLDAAQEAVSFSKGKTRDKCQGTQRFTKLGDTNFYDSVPVHSGSMPT